MENNRWPYLKGCASRKDIFPLNVRKVSDINIETLEERQRENSALRQGSEPRHFSSQDLHLGPLRNEEAGTSGGGTAAGVTEAVTNAPHSPILESSTTNKGTLEHIQFFLAMSYSEEKDVPENSPRRSSSSQDLEHCPLTGEDGLYHVKERRRWRIRWPSNDSSLWKIYSLFMTAITLAMVVTAIHNSIRPICTATEKPAQSSHTTDPLESYPLPADTWKKENLVETRFYRDLRYMTLDHDSDYLWQEHLFMASGNIRLPPPDGKGNASLKGIAMFHQMHCLAKMRMTLQLAREGVDIGVDWRDDAHWPHCFDYLRESILCYADPTLESVSLQPGPVDDGTFVKVIDGGAEMRYCRDSRPLYELERQYGPNSKYGFEAAEEFQIAPGK
ncbi:uncharacterized protein BDR25DRAFT_346819 [Lindgomyces ingoldianus]|uniref:Uncharacterized protein n=1 Tax=Lindgomyces ingoldianus TaxID=673940 RepID=A0ACB6QBN0_9PLEO|nr:uncharacterized protein BDR25DRAFT_346819 [Lindgomyces ingoldianus]KAF2464343.1 hypothetical protein BDR25DRAFT_346819 [Lindgomyces ingoldianus]